MPKFSCLSILIFLALAPFQPCYAQPSSKVYRIGYLGTSVRGAFAEAFEQGLRDHGYQIGKNLVIEYRFAGGKIDRLPALAAELVRLNVDVMVTGINPTIIAAMRATTTIPIVTTFSNDPVGGKLIASLARPGGNLTGLSVDTGDEFLGKRLELLKGAANKISRLAVLYNSDNVGHRLYLKNMVGPANALGFSLLPTGYRDQGAFDSAFDTMVANQAEGVFLFSDGVSFRKRPLIASLAVKHRLPAGYPAKEYVEAGGLMSYGPDLLHISRRGAAYVDKILKGARPADLPVEQPTKFELVVNLKAARQIGITIPPSVLAGADQVIR